MTKQDIFREELCGITPQEVAGLLSLIMRREFHVFTNTTGRKRVRKWKGDLLGIPISVTEVDSDYIPISSLNFCGGKRGLVIYKEICRHADYHIESLEWEFKVSVDNPSSVLVNRDRSAEAKLGNFRVELRNPWFEGDENDYVREMSMIRLLGLSNEDTDAPRL